MSVACDAQSLSDAAACFECIPNGQQMAIQSYLLALIAGVSTDPQTLAKNASCFECIPDGMQPAVHSYLICQAVNAGGGQTINACVQALLNNSVIVCPTNGNNSTGVRGTVNAFLSLEAANAAAQDNDTIYVLPGHTRVDTGVLLKNGVKLQGAGIDISYLDFYQVGGGVPCCIIPSTGSYIYGLTIDCKLAGTGVYRAGIGANTLYAHPGATGFVVNSVKILAESDGIYFRSRNVYQGSFENCIIQSQWNCLTMFQAGHNISLYKCTLSTSCDSTLNPGSGDCVIITDDAFGGSPVVNLYICTLNVTYTSGAGSGYAILLTPSGAPVARVNLYGCTANVSGAHAFAAYLNDDSHFIFSINSTGLSLLKITGDTLGSGNVLVVTDVLQNLTTTKSLAIVGDYGLITGQMIHNTTTGTNQCWGGTAWNTVV